MYSDVPAQHERVFESTCTACEGGSVSTPEAGRQLVKGEQESQQEGVRAA